MTDVALVELLTEQTNEAVRAKYADAALCVLATAVFCRAADYFDVTAVPVPCIATALNPVCAAVLESGGDMHTQECYDAGGRYVRTVNDASLGGYGGHLIAQVDDLLIDADAGQFHRAEKQIIMPPTLIMDVSATDWPDKPVVWKMTNGALLIYETNPAPVFDYRRAPDWTDRKAKPLAGQVIRAVRSLAVQH
jgi:hypothetical protein